MTEGNPLTTILLFAVPMIFSNLFQQFYNVIDTIIVGKRLGSDALAAVGSAGSIIAVFAQLATGFALGGAIVIAQYFGAGKTKEIWKCASTSTVFSAGIALVSTFFIWICAEWIMRLVNTPEDIIPIGVSYLRFYFLGCVPIFVYNSLNSVYVALGDSKTPLKFLMVSSMLNVILDLFFIISLNAGVAGAALATAISQFAAAAMAFIYMPGLLSGADIKSSVSEADIKSDVSEAAMQAEISATDIKKQKLRFKGSLSVKDFFDTELLLIMLKLALPSALQQSIVSVGSVIVQATVNGFGEAVIAGSAAASKVVNFATTIPINYSNAYSNYVGQNIGADKSERIWPGLKASMFCCGIISLVMTVVFELFPTQIIGMFIEDNGADVEQVISIGAEYIRVVGAFLVIFSVFMLIKATFKGSGDMSWFIITTLLSFFIRLFLTVGLAKRVGVGIIWWSFGIGWGVALIVAALRYVQGGWRKKAVI